jgi:hypothetical protein
MAGNESNGRGSLTIYLSGLIDRASRHDMGARDAIHPLRRVLLANNAAHRAANGGANTSA